MIAVENRDRVVHLQIDAPPVNVLDAQVLGELKAKIEECSAGEETAAVMLSGAGRCFSAGASVEEHAPDKAPQMVHALLEACAALVDSPAPVVALVHGPCLGGAMELVEFCDFVVADPDATLGQPEIKLAFFPPVAVYQLPRIAGVQNAAYSIFTGATLDAERARAMGIVQEILPRDEWGKMDKTFNRLSAAALRMTKRAFLAGIGSYRRERLEEIAQLFLGDLYQLEDVAEGIASFAQKRRPQWRHR